MNEIELEVIDAEEKAEEDDQILDQDSAWTRVRMWIRQRSYAGSSMESVNITITTLETYIKTCNVFM